MNKDQLAELIAGEVNIPKSAAGRAVDSMLDNITKAIKAGDKVNLTGFGTFTAKVRHARAGVNPQNPHEKIQMPEVIVPKFKAGKSLKDILKGKAKT